MVKLYFDPGMLEGHVLEYLHHYYMAHLKSDYDMIYVVGENFNNVKDVYKWPDYDKQNIIVVPNSRPYDVESFYKRSKTRCELLGKVIKEYSVELVYLPFLIKQMPLLPFYIPRGCKVDGIIYNLPYYNSSANIVKKTIDYLIYRSFSKCSAFRNVYLLNASKCVEFYNHKYNTTNFCFLPDPFNNDTQDIISIREMYNIAQDDIVLCQFGYISKQKRVLNIVDAMTNLPPELANRCVYIVAGKVEDQFKDEFLKAVRDAQSKARIIAIPEFVSTGFINGMCKEGDFLMMPYENNGKSSGMFGYASYFGIPLVASKGGLIEEIINDYKLGYCLEDISSKGIVSFITKHVADKTRPTQAYYVDHHVSIFKETLCS